MRKYQQPEEYFEERIDSMAEEFGESREAMLGRIREWYNGYNWTGKERLYNPFSILNFFEGGQFQNFWFATGTPAFLLRQYSRTRFSGKNGGGLSLRFVYCPEPAGVSHPL